MINVPYKEVIFNNCPTNFFVQFKLSPVSNPHHQQLGLMPRFCNIKEIYKFRKLNFRVIIILTFMNFS